jgi:hypothetical protein
LTVKPASLTVRVKMDNDRQLAITMDCQEGFETVKEQVPEYYALFKSWADHFEEEGWPDVESDSPVS